MPTRTILQTFVSANKSDNYRCDSTRSDAHLSPPYACAYSHGELGRIVIHWSMLTLLQAAKRGGKPLLAVATEEGTLNIMDTTKRSDWDFGEYLALHPCPFLTFELQNHNEQPYCRMRMESSTSSGINQTISLRQLQATTQSPSHQFRVNFP